MANQPTAAPQSYEPEAQYRVELARFARLGGLKLRPLAEITLAGATVTRLIAQEGADIVLSATKL